MWNLHSRVHKLNAFPNHYVQCYVKRDDELGCGISGTKLRKYAGLIPFFKENLIAHLIIIAGPQSNNLLAALQVARELQLKVTVFLLKPKNPVIQGNFKLSLLFINEEDLVWVERGNWHAVEELAREYCRTLNESAFVLNEGASAPEAMKGAMSLAHDLRRNEQELGIIFQHIFIDAGTGFAAAALIKGLVQINHPALIHVLLLADDEAIFHDKIQQWLGFMPQNYSCFYPQTARSFGSLNQEIKSEIKRLAQEEGILAEPVYSAKLFHEARRRIEANMVSGPVLIIHSGGLLTMAGFSL